jgi:hypothetical protein
MLFKGIRIKGFWPFSKPAMHCPSPTDLIITLSMPPLVSKTDENQKEPDVDCMVGGQELPNSVSSVSSLYGQQYDRKHGHVKKNV